MEPPGGGRSDSRADAAADAGRVDSGESLRLRDRPGGLLDSAGTEGRQRTLDLQPRADVLGPHERRSGAATARLSQRRTVCHLSALPTIFFLVNLSWSVLGVAVVLLGTACERETRLSLGNL